MYNYTEFVYLCVINVHFSFFHNYVQVTESGNPWFRQELEFDLVTVNIDDILDNVQDLSGSGSVE